MRKEELIQKIDALGKAFFTLLEVRKLFPHDKHVKVHVKRIMDAGLILPITKGVYTFASHPVDLEHVVTQLYYPSYISFESVLSKYGIMNQGQNILTLATIRHSKRMNLMNIECEYRQLKKDYFFGFQLLDGVYLADPEKAFIDLFYLIALGKRKMDYSEWNLDGLKNKKMQQYLKKYPIHFRDRVNHLLQS
ncbi:MAG: hypothetical protein PHD83_00350 [Caldisericia bacterium]|nr:hypothetical protein [Caldisericia bacterium]